MKKHWTTRVNDDLATLKHQVAQRDRCIRELVEAQSSLQKQVSDAVASNVLLTAQLRAAKVDLKITVGSTNDEINRLKKVHEEELGRARSENVGSAKPGRKSSRPRTRKIQPEKRKAG